MSCAGSFERNASVLRAIAVARWYRCRGDLRLLALEATDPNVALATKFGIPVAHLGGIRKFLSLLWAQPAQIVTVHLVNVSVKNALLAGLAALVGGRVVADWDEWASKIPAQLPRKTMWLLVEKLMFGLADRFVVASKFLCTELQGELGSRTRVSYIPYGFDLPGETIVEQGTLPVGMRYLAYVGSFSANYSADIEELLRAARAAAPHGVELLLIGEGETLPALRAGLSASGCRAHYLGRMSPEEVDAWLAHPQIVAGFLPLQKNRQNLARCPNKLFHYIRASLPIVTNAVGEAQEALGSAGLYYQFGDEIQLSHCIGAALQTIPSYNLSQYTWDFRLAHLEPVVPESVGSAATI